MSKLLENPQIIHIISEVVVFIGITFYFSQKNKKLMNHINDLTQRLEDQEDIIQKHEQLILKLMNSVDELQKINQQPPQQAPQQFKQQTQQTQQTQQPRQIQKSLKQTLKESLPNVKKVFIDVQKKEPIIQVSKVEEIEDEEDDYVDDSQDHEDDLDAELAEELAELDEIET